MRRQDSRRPIYRLFFALKPPLMIARQIDHFAEGRAGGVSRIHVEHQHITLAITGDYAVHPQEIADRLRRAGAMVMADPFDLRLDRLSFANRSVALRPTHALSSLTDLQGEIVRAMRDMGVPRRADWSFSPHQTLFYRDGPVGQRHVKGFGWHVEDFVLICSHVGHTHHEELGRWPLQGGAQLSLF